MAADDTEERKRLVEVLRSRLKRVPQGVVNGGVREVRAYMEISKKAQKLVDAKVLPPLAKLQASVMATNPYCN